jgi:hypothetical protein
VSPRLLALGIAAAHVPVAHAETPSLQSAIGDPDGFRLSGSVRLRYEALDGQPRAGFRPEDEQLDLRSTLFAEADTGVVRIGAEMYDSRAWLAQPGSAISANEVNTFELVQAMSRRTSKSRSAKAASSPSRPGGSRSTSARGAWSPPTTTATPPTATPACAPT